jgi:hypothetical protein
MLCLLILGIPAYSLVLLETKRGQLCGPGQAQEGIYLLSLQVEGLYFFYCGAGEQ